VAKGGIEADLGETALDQACRIIALHRARLLLQRWKRGERKPIALFCGWTASDVSVDAEFRPKLDWRCSKASQPRNVIMDTVPPPPPLTTTIVSSSSEDKTVAIVAYLTFIGFIVAIILHGNKKTQLGTYHLRQALGLMLTALGLWICMMIVAIIPILGWLLAICLWLVMLALIVPWIFGLIAAANGQIKPVPVLGTYYEKWFGNAFT
jgi:uncharacterized membrane protein